MSFDSINNVTKKVLQSNRRFVIVEFKEELKPVHKCLAFLVKDVKNAECPGHPACAVEYFDSFKEGKRKIEALYKKVGYTPKYPIDKYVSRYNK